MLPLLKELGLFVLEIIDGRVLQMFFCVDSLKYYSTKILEMTTNSFQFPNPI